MRSWTFVFGPIVALTTVLSFSHVRAAPIVQAATGTPFGVARVTVRLDPTEDSSIVDTNGYSIEQRNGRVLYPAFGHTRLLGTLRQIVGASRPSGRTTVTAFFLFKGDRPFQVTIRTPGRHTCTVLPKQDDELFEKLRGSWWRQFTAVAELQKLRSDYPVIVETYLAAMLAKRLGLPSPLVDEDSDAKPPVSQESLLLILDVESMRMRALQRALMRPPPLDIEANLSLPDEIEWPKVRVPTPSDDVEVEPIAMRVPEECFYVRFGSFTNYLWSKRLLEQNGGSVGRMVVMRGHDPLLEERVQQQLGLRETSLADLLGPRIISDVAVIGRDIYLREGAAVGILFEARNNLLTGELRSQRTNAVRERKKDGATFEDIELLGRKVSFASTPNNELRSFHVVHGAYHLVTNSKAIAKRFIRVCDGEPPLGASEAFRNARKRYPSSKKETVFTYISPAFFHGLVSPQYQIELRRRLMAITQMELVNMAHLAAIHEDKPHDTVEELHQSGLLPTYFESRADGSRLLKQNGHFVDSRRGARGRFLPIPDVPISGITPAEANTLKKIQSFHKQSWSQIDALVLELKRTPLKQKGRERLIIRMEMLPFAPAEYGRMLTVVGPPSRDVVRSSSDNAVTIQAVLQGGNYRPEIKEHIMFLGIQDKEVPVDFVPQRTLRILQVLRTAPAYVGSFPRLGFFDAIPLDRPPTPDEDGYARMPFGLWQRRLDEFSVIAVDRGVLSDATTDLTIEQADNDAQLRIHIDDLTKSKVRSWFAALDFQRAYQTSVGNTRLLHNMTQQLGVPADEALSTAEKVLGVTLICALGGEYELLSHPLYGQHWSSTRWPSRVAEAESPKATFASPVMAWFRGLDAEFTMKSDRLTGIATMEIQNPVEGAPQVPLFNLFRKREN